MKRLFILLLLLPASGWTAIRLAMGPIRGEAKYPLVMSGLRQVLMSDLAQTGQIELVETSIPTDRFTASNLSDLASQISADVVLLGTFMERAPTFTVTIRAYDVGTGYNLGSVDLAGSYSELKFFQDRLLSAVSELLRTSISPQQRANLNKAHTENVGAVAALGEADAALGEKRYVDALEGFSKARSMDQNFQTPQYQLQKMGTNLVARIADPVSQGRAFAFIGDVAQAKAHYETALQKNGSDISALVGKADLLLQSGKPQEALPLYKRANELDSKNAMAWIGLARTYEALGQSALSLAAYEKAKDLGVTRPEVYEALGSLYVAKKQPKAAAEVYQVAGELAERSANFRKAQDYYARVNQIAPSVTAMEKQAALFLTSGETQLAITILTKAMFVDPNRDTIYASLGYAYYLNQQPSQALKMFKKAYDLNPSNFDANYYLGMLLLAERESRAMAIKHLEIALKIKPNDKQIHYLLAQGYLGDKRVSDAVNLLEKLVRSLPRDSQTQKELGDVYFTAGEFDLAKAAYQRAIELSPDYREAYEGLAKAYIRLGQRKEAIATIEKIYTIDATNNVFIREGLDLLGELTPKELIQVALMFPKTVPTSSGLVPINQIALVQITDEQGILGRIKKWFEIYRLDQNRLLQDIELALYSRYRVLPSRKMGSISSQKLSASEFQDRNSLKAVASTIGAEGVFGFEITNIAKRGNVAEISLNLTLQSMPDNGLYGITDQSMAPRLTYLREEILYFNSAGVLFLLIAALLIALPFSYITIYQSHKKGRGNLKVIIHYDPKLESFLTLKLSKKQEKERDSKLVIVKDSAKYEKRKYKDLLRQKGAWVRKMVGKITLFENVPVREYFCYLYGTIEDTKLTKATIGNYFMVQRVRLEKGKTKEIVFQLEKEEAFVTVFVRKGDDDIVGAHIRVNDESEVKFSRGAAGAFIYLKKGKHKITVTHEGRTIERSLELFDLEDKIVHIDMQTVDEAQDAATEGRPLTDVAQEFESQGRLEEAAQLYDKAGASDRASETRTQALMSEGNLEAAAQELVRSREFIRAAEIYQQLGNSDKANYLYGLHCYQQGEIEKAEQYLSDSNHYGLLAKIYDRMGDKKKAMGATAKDYLAKGQKIEAAQAFVQAEEFSQAAEIYEGLEDFTKAATLHAKDGNYSLAGEMFARVGDLKRAAMSFEKGGLFDQAISIFRDLGETNKVIELLERDERHLDAAKLYRDQGMIDEAIALCQKVPSFHADYPSIQLLLGQLFAEKGMDDLAMKTFTEAMASNLGAFDTQSSYTYALLLERKKEYKKALEVFEELLKKDFHFKDVSIKVNELKTKVAQMPVRPAANVSETISGATPPKESRYDVLSELGRGAMGVVYKARDRMLDRIVAYKTLPHTLKDDPDALESLMKEAQTAAKLNHPNIVTVYDVGHENGTYFMAMEYVEGKTLQQILKQIKKIDLTNFRHIAKTLCDVVAYAHSQHVIHRDIKPSNILLLPSRTVKLMDFGLAKVLQDISIDKTMLRGTPLYMSPEQVLGKDIDHRTDIYSLGILFYEMLGGKPPFIEGDIMYAHLHTQPASLSEIAPGVPGPICDAVMSCLAKDKKSRPSSATDLSAAIR